MHYHKLLRTLWGALLIAIASGCGPGENPAGSAEHAARNASDVLNSVRLKQFAKALELTDEQQQKLKVIYDAEAAQIAQIDQDTSLSLNDRTTRVTDVKKGTHEKIKPLLTPEQLEKFEQIINKPQKRKKSN